MTSDFNINRYVNVTLKVVTQKVPNIKTEVEGPLLKKLMITELVTSQK